MSNQLKSAHERVMDAIDAGQSWDEVGTLIQSMVETKGPSVNTFSCTICRKTVEYPDCDNVIKYICDTYGWTVHHCNFALLCPECEEIDKEKRRVSESTTLFCEEWMKENIPEWARGAVVAEYMEREPDALGDSWVWMAPTKIIILKWSTHTKRLFPEMKKAALTSDVEEIKTLASKQFEHRDDTFAGRRYYLKDGRDNEEGWEVRKTRVSMWGFKEMAMISSCQNKT